MLHHTLPYTSATICTSYIAIHLCYNCYIIHCQPIHLCYNCYIIHCHTLLIQLLHHTLPYTSATIVTSYIAIHLCYNLYIIHCHTPLLQLLHHTLPAHTPLLQFLHHTLPYTSATILTSYIAIHLCYNSYIIHCHTPLLQFLHHTLPYTSAATKCYSNTHNHSAAPTIAPPPPPPPPPPVSTPKPTPLGCFSPYSRSMGYFQGPPKTTNHPHIKLFWFGVAAGGPFNFRVARRYRLLVLYESITYRIVSYKIVCHFVVFKN